jgi:hippurate hydrolase
MGIVRNGAGRTVLLRADMDALQVHGRTQRMVDMDNSVEKPVMHACGHNVTALC